MFLWGAKKPNTPSLNDTMSSFYRDDQVVVGSFELLPFSHHVSIITPSIYGFLVCFKSAAVIMCGQWSLFNGALAEKSRLWRGGGGDGHALHCWQTNQ